MIFFIIFSCATLAACRNYSDYLAREVSLTLCDAAYSYNPSKFLRSKLRASEVQTFSVDIDGGTSTGIIAILKDRNIVALTFRSQVTMSGVDLRHLLPMISSKKVLRKKTTSF
ncbi:hypothetical protein ANCCAN_26491 [Ancylostoma caninum]|uniref:Uncharacterized protein n=1 Tax=Ancylostoma caninum TaxID=29170 RepID=A0A368F6S8_ANCCA|nr:hypothetical protein ANCCAN_26491 [Ancylostoma caninum]